MAAHPTDHLANERTYLAWVRTAIAIIALGFVVARFGLFLREIAGTAGPSPSAEPFSEWTGVFLVLAGAVLLTLAFARYRQNRVDLEVGNYQARSGLEWGLTGILVAVGVGLATYLVVTA